MKKIIAMCLTLLMVFSVTVYADSYDCLFFDMKSGSVSFNVTFKCDDSYALQAFDISEIADFDCLIDGANDILLNTTVDYEFNNDYSAGKIIVAVDSYIPVKMNKNMELTVKYKNYVWALYDVTDESNPVIKIIHLSPLSKKYMVYDFVEELSLYGCEIKEISSAFKEIINEKTISEYKESLKEIYKANSELTCEKGEYVLKINDKQFENIFNSMMEKMPEIFKSGSVFGFDIYFFDPTLEEIDRVFEDVCFDCEVKGKINKEGNNESYTLNVNCTYDLKQPDGGTKALEFSMNADGKYLPYNASSTIGIPELTKDNSQVYDEDAMYSYNDCSYVEVENEYIQAKDGSFYVSLGSVLSQIKDENHSYTVCNDGSKVVITSTSDCDKFDRVELTVGSNEYVADSVKGEMDNPVIYVDDKIYTDNTFFINVFGFERGTCEAELIKRTCSSTFWRDCKYQNEDIYDIISNTTSYEDEYDDDYRLCLHIQRAEVPINIADFEEGYFGIRSFVDSHCNDNGANGQIDISYDNGVITLKNNFADADYFKEACITVGSDTVVADGVEYKVSMPAVNRDGIVYVDAETIKAIFKYELYTACVRYNTPSVKEDDYVNDLLFMPKSLDKYARFRRISPICTHYKSIEEYTSR